MVRIPEEYQEVEYVESSSDRDQFILTDILMPKEIVCYHTFTLLQYKDQYGWGAIGNGFSGAGFGQYAYKLQYNYSGSYKYVGNPAISIGKKYSTKLILLDGRQELYVDGVQGQSWNKANTKDGENIRIALFRANGSSLRGAMRMYYIKFTNADESIILGEFIPCYRKSDNEIGMYDTVSKTFYTNSGTGTFLKGHNVYYDDVNLLEQRRKILLNTPHLETIQNNIATFNTDMNVSLKDCKIYFSPIQEGEGDPSPDNVRPIEGWDGIEITRTGKNIYSGWQLVNLLKPSGYSDAQIYEDEDGRSVNALGNNLDVYYDFPNGLFKENTQYTLILKSYSSIDVSFFRIKYTDNTQTWISPPKGMSTRSYVTSANKTIKSINCINRTATRRVYFEESGFFEGVLTAADFEPYEATSLNITFPQTIYGGYVDLIKGEIVEEWYSITFDGENIKATNDYSNNNFIRAYWVYFSPAGYNIQKAFCNKLTISYNDSSSVFPFLRLEKVGGLYGGLVLGTPENYPELANGTKADRINAINNWFKENPTQVVYKLATPIIHSINPQTLKALKGTNNIFSNANGNIEIKFWKH